MEETDFQKQELCIFCNKNLNDNRVRDHDHYTGKYESGAHMHWDGAERGLSSSVAGKGEDLVGGRELCAIRMS